MARRRKTCRLCGRPAVVATPLFHVQLKRLDALPQMWFLCDACWTALIVGYDANHLHLSIDQFMDEQTGRCRVARFVRALSLAQINEALA